MLWTSTLDEPTSGLAPKSRRRLINLLKTFSHIEIIATHDLEFALEVCSRAIVIHQGCINADDPIKEIFSNLDLLDKSGLEAPLSMNQKTKTDRKILNRAKNRVFLLFFYSLLFTVCMLCNSPCHYNRGSKYNPQKHSVRKEKEIKGSWYANK